MMSWTALAAFAFAWDHAGTVVDLPATWSIEGACPPSLANCELLAAQAVGSWEGSVACRDLSAGRVEEDGLITFSFGDPEGALEAGVLSATVVSRTGETVSLDGATFELVEHVQIVVNDGVDWALPGDCEGVSAQHVLVQAVGSAYGLALTYPGDDASPDEQGAAMSAVQEVPSCEPLLPNADDFAGMEALYRRRAEVSCSPTVGEAPLTVQCVVGGESPIASAGWSFGDGATAEGIAVEHTYASAGAFTPRVEVEGSLATCDDAVWTDEPSALVPVVACGPPEPVFTAEWLVGRRWQIVNDTEILDQACFRDILWTVHEGEDATGEIVAQEGNWEPEIELPGRGPYTVVVNIAGISETRAAALTLQDSGCGGSRAALLVPLLLLRRRRG